ncbi:hypothetical protein GRS48_10365 [Halorubrum sp. JWXQ-INN 858]|uniref:hypothetical protein n=1 Tax=Halorubrum sp. JWXQ-INN 858 TaxID=2690782 RepID=UPI00135702AA|nr:hypothetical protein [Halorubrum sp. JWXQ-INN 858]MWV65220.1 hypothetical protein [Halorubrum sp. JWXQ-INN 858]
MDEKTEELRDLFIDATGADTVTESQSESPGSLTGRDEAAVDERVRELIATMRDRYGFETALDDAGYERVVRGYFEGDDDAGIATALDVDAATVRRARLDLHLVADADRDAPFDYGRLKRLVAEERPVEECATVLDVDAATIAEYAAVARTELTAARANGRFHDEFRELLTDAAIEGSYAADAREDGLRDATEDLETDVSL